MLLVATVEIENDSFYDILGDKTVVHLSDLHFSEGENPQLNKILIRLEHLKPDILFLSGDYVEWFALDRAYEQAEYFLSRLKATYGVYAVMGDADYTFGRKHCIFCHTENSAKPPIKHSVQFLRDTKTIIQIEGKKLSVIGLDCNVNLSPNLHLISSLTDSLPTVFLSHTSLPFNEIDPDKNLLMLSGDTHGGQVYLPIWVWKILKRKADPEHMYGYFREKNKHLYVNDGVGTSHLDIRFGVPPKIAVLKFLPSGGDK